MRTLAEDTSPEAERVLLLRWRQAAPARKFALVLDTTRSMREFMLAGLRDRHPQETPARLRRLFADLWLGPDLARKAWKAARCDLRGRGTLSTIQTPAAALAREKKAKLVTGNPEFKEVQKQISPMSARRASAFGMSWWNGEPGQAALANARHAFAHARQVFAHCFIAWSSLNFSHSVAQVSHIFAHASAACAPAGPKHDWMHAEHDDAHAEHSSRHFA
jgi:hypothetical protein